MKEVSLLVLFDNHEFEDDNDISFSEYEYALSIIKLRAGAKYKSYDNIYNDIAAFLTEKLSYAFGSNVILVDNLQNVVLSSTPVTAM